MSMIATSALLVNILQSSTPTLTQLMNTSNFQWKKKKTDPSHFLDTMTSRNPDGTIKTSVYRKATHTDKYLQFNSHHPTQHKRSVARTLLDRAKNIPSTDADKLSEVQHVVDALKINGYTDQFIRSCQSTTVSTNQSQTSRDFVTLPYLQGISEKIARTLNQFNINVAHKPIMTIGSILKNLKKNLVRTYRQEWSIKLIVKTATKFISAKCQGP